MVVTGPIANCVADLTLLYAVMANVNYSNTDTRKPGAASLALPGVAEAAAEAAAAPPRPLGLPKVLLEVPEDAPESCNQVDLAQTKPLQGFRVGVFPKVRNTHRVGFPAQPGERALVALAACSVYVPDTRYCSACVCAGHDTAIMSTLTPSALSAPSFVAVLLLHPNSGPMTAALRLPTSCAPHSTTWCSWAHSRWRSACQSWSSHRWVCAHVRMRALVVELCTVRVCMCVC